MGSCAACSNKDFYTSGTPLAPAGRAPEEPIGVRIGNKGSPIFEPLACLIDVYYGQDIMSTKLSMVYT